MKTHALLQGSDTAKCVFCGGFTQATERDHVPARALFVQRQWPEGYEFPACAECNRASSSDEQILALLVRLRNSDIDVPEAEFQQAVLAVRNNHRGLAESMIMSLREKRRALAQLGLVAPISADVRSLPLMTVKDPRWHEATQRYGRKLARALLYLHTDRIAPADSDITVRWLTAYSDGSQDMVAAFAQTTSEISIPMRSGKSLDTQFLYRFAVGSEFVVGAFLILFGPSLCLLTLLDGRPLHERVHNAEEPDD